MDVKTLLREQWDRVAGIGCVVLGALALLLGWIGISGTSLSYKQLPYIISGGLLGIALIGVGATSWLSADLRDEWRKLDRLDESVRALAEVPVPVALEPVAEETLVPPPVAVASNGKGSRPTARRAVRPSSGLGQG